MHTSLTVRTNVLLLLVYLAVVVVCSVISPPSQLPFLAPFVIAGLAAGAFQAKAISASPAAFRSAETWTAVRNALASSRLGKASLGLLWCNGFAILLFVLFGSSVATLSTLLGAYASFGLARELATLPSVLALRVTT